MLNRFLRWLAPKPRPVDEPFYTETPVFIGDLTKAIRREDDVARRLDIASATVGDYARMSGDFHRRARRNYLAVEITRLKRNKKRHSHLQQELDSLNA